MKKATPVSQEESQTSREISTGLSGDELDQVRELLFGGTIREIERQREALQKDVNAGFAEADQMTHRRLDDVMRRLDALHAELEHDREQRKQQMAAEAQRIDKALVKLASEQASALSKETQRIDDAIAAETRRVNDVLANEAKRVDDALAKESKRLDDALDAFHRQIETDKLQHIDALRKSVSTERVRLAQGIRQLAEGINKDKVTE